MITNANVKGVNQNFPNAHHEKELVLKKHSVIKEIDADKEGNIQFDFVSFSAIQPDRTRTTGIGKVSLLFNWILFLK